MPAKIGIGFDGTDSGEDALAVGLVLARATRAVPLVAVVHPQEYPIGVGRVDAEWVAYMHEHAVELLGRARRLVSDEHAAEFLEISGPLGVSRPARAGRAGAGRAGGGRLLLPGPDGPHPHGQHRRAAAPGIGLPGRGRPQGPARVAARAAGHRGRGLPRYPEARHALDVAVDLAGRPESGAGSRPTPSCWRAGWSTPRPPSTGATPTCWSAGPGPTGPLRRVLLGGVSSRLLRRSALPLLVVPRSGHDGDA